MTLRERLPLFHLVEEPALLLLDRFDVLLVLQMVTHGRVHVNLSALARRQPVELAQQGRQALCDLALQDALGVEVTGQQLAQPPADEVRERQGDADRGALGVVHVDLGEGGSLLDELLPPAGELLLQVGQHPLDVFARADGVGAVVGAGAGVEAFRERANLNRIGLLGG